MCLLCGSDYLENIKGLGLVVILEFFDDDYNEKGKLQDYFKKKITKGFSKSKLLPKNTKSLKEYLNLLENIENGLE